MHALGAEGRRFESCLPDQNPPVSQGAAEGPNGNEGRTPEANGNESHGIVPDNPPPAPTLRERIMARRRGERPPVVEMSTDEWLADYRTKHSRDMNWMARRPPIANVVYFIGGETGPIKIGFTGFLGDRLATLRANSPIPLNVLATVEGTFEIEDAYHRQFASHRLHGEWFDRHPDILRLIDAVNAAA